MSREFTAADGTKFTTAVGAEHTLDLPRLDESAFKRAVSMIVSATADHGVEMMAVEPSHYDQSLGRRFSTVYKFQDWRLDELGVTYKPTVRAAMAKVIVPEAQARFDRLGLGKIPAGLHFYTLEAEAADTFNTLASVEVHPPVQQFDSGIYHFLPNGTSIHSKHKPDGGIVVDHEPVDNTRLEFISDLLSRMTDVG